MTAQYDMVIRGGLVVDGTGAEPAKADITASGEVTAKDDAPTGALPGRRLKGAGWSAKTAKQMEQAQL